MRYLEFLKDNCERLILFLIVLSIIITGAILIPVGISHQNLPLIGIGFSLILMIFVVVIAKFTVDRRRHSGYDEIE